ncbi:hypothetical protein F5146DRAFT_1068591 [Armillaria mellea]|nr:hypothetical protein F5146DRAFT_1068591 [Armillaria mellea]
MQLPLHWILIKMITRMFPLILCSAILHSFQTSPKGLTQDFHSPLLLDFIDVLLYLRDKIYDDILGMFSKFIKHPSLSEPSLPRSLKVVMAAIKFLHHRLSLPEYDKSHTTIRRSLTAAIQRISYQVFSSQEATALIVVLEDIIAPYVVPPLKLNLRDLCDCTILAYHSLTRIAPSACSLRGLQLMVDFMINHWDKTYYTACGVLTDLLVKHIPVAFTVFHESQCLQFLGRHPFHEASVPMIRAYVAGRFAMQQGSGGAMDAESLQQHIDYLHDPQILFIVCSILAAHGTKNVDRSPIHRDIMTLAQLHPHDAAWDECRRKLDNLVQSEDGEFLSEQRGLDFHLLRPEEIHVQKDNVRYAMHVLDDFFDGGGHTIVNRCPFPRSKFSTDN